jgi:hypothetical protein
LDLSLLYLKVYLEFQGLLYQNNTNTARIIDKSLW